MRIATLRLAVLTVFATALVGGLPLAATAVPFTFACITGNDAGDCAIGEAQIGVDVTDEGGGLVRFTFTNAGPSDSSIEGVYFDDGSLLGIASVLNGSGVDFTGGSASPPNLPGANNASPPFQTTAGFLADSNPPTQPNGVNPGETLAIVFDLQGTQTFADVLSELADGSLRIGIHVIGFASGGSESFVNDVPEPAAVGLLLGAGLLGIRRRR